MNQKFALTWAKWFLVLILFFFYFNAFCQSAFVENKGQWNKNVQFKYSLPTGSLFAEENGVTFNLVNTNDIKISKSHHAYKNSAIPKYIRFHAYKMSFLNAKPTNPIGSEAYSDYENYYIGKNSSQWASKVQRYKRITWNNIYKKNRTALVIIITSVSELGLQIYEGSKAAAITSLLPVAFFISRLNKRQKWSQLSLLLLICLLFVFIFPYVDAVRNDRDYVLVGYDFADNLAARLCWLPNLALIMSAIPRSIPYWHGASIWPAFTWFIPRIIWPDKPVLSIGSWFAKTFLNWAEDSLSEAAITIWGDAYLNFGVPGIVFISIFLGISYAYTYKRWYLRGRTALDYVIYWVFISELIFGLEKNIAAIIGALFQQILVVLVLWVVMRIRLPRSKGSIPV